MKRLLVLYSSILALLLSSCSVEPYSGDPDPIDPVETNLKLKQRIVNYLDGDVVTETFAYDDDKLTSINGSDTSVITYNYEGDLLTQIIDAAAAGNLLTTNLAYDSQERLINYRMTTDDEVLEYEFSYYTDGSITRTFYFGGKENSTGASGESILTFQNEQLVKETKDDGQIITYAYDDQKSSYLGIANIKTINLVSVDFNGYIDSSVNNLLTATITENGTDFVDEKYEYTYNEAGYPVTATYYLEGEPDSELEFVYESL
ncbi:hypothetical protein [Leeuwenhoekiella parthenopeia]|uniref:YD repeat-containing protein n=1 Tax=Leeuwenhoekiella parthenopeia TaxID=2890320 RepID=A0ABS8GXF8_9FLAO|nr:hypothetical protein [Leeuwenhoekiella parthenopeia]MCC4214695.1 hypothetical protein [Leeuwenhoekiella parthenopeia]